MRIREDREVGSSFETLVLSSLVDALRPSMFVSVTICRNSSVYPSFRDKMEDLQKFFEKSRLDTLRLQWLMTYSFRRMVDGVRGCLVDHAFLMANVHKLPSFVNRSFPRYAEAGYLGMICKHGRGSERR
jgi:hypothetical protein